MQSAHNIRQYSTDSGYIKSGIIYSIQTQKAACLMIVGKLMMSRHIKFEMRSSDWSLISAIKLTCTISRSCSRACYRFRQQRLVFVTIVTVLQITRLVVRSFLLLGLNPSFLHFVASASLYNLVNKSNQVHNSV